MSFILKPNLEKMLEEVSPKLNLQCSQCCVHSSWPSFSHAFRKHGVPTMFQALCLALGVQI